MAAGSLLLYAAHGLIIALLAAFPATTLAHPLASDAPQPRYPIGHPYYQEPHIRINSISDLDPRYARRAMKDVTTTISEVQKILATNPHLPRLTRGEIEELFENVTREEFEKSMRNGDRSRAKHMRALMVVLPYNTNNYSDDTLQELYTRPPVTRVVSDSDAKIVRPQQIIVPSTHTETDRDTRPPTTYKPQLITRKAQPQQQPLATTFHPPKTLATIFTRLPTYSAPGKAFQAAAPATTAAATSTAKPSTTTTARPTTTTSTTTTTTTSTTPKPPPPEKFSSHFNAHNLPFQPHQQTAPMRHNVKDLLASIGLTAEVTTQRPSVELTDDMRELLRTFGLLTNEQPPSHFNYDAVQQQQQQLAAQEAALGFDPDSLYELGGGEQEEFLPIPSYNFQADGGFDNVAATNEANGIGGGDALLPDLEPTSVTKNYRMHDAPDPAAADYFAFKPLPVAHEEFGADVHQGPASVNADMEAFLRSYGLLDAGINRNKKSIDASVEATTTTATTSTTTLAPTTPLPTRSNLRRMDKIPAVQVDFLSPQLLNVLGNLGISNGGQTSRIVPTAQATRRSDEIQDEQAIYTIETTKDTQSAMPTAKVVPPTKMYPVFKPDAEATTTIETKPAKATEETKTAPATAETKAAPTKRASTSHSTASSGPTGDATKPTVFVVLPTNSIPQTSSTVIQSVSSAIGKPDATPSLSEAASDYAKLQFLLATVKKLDQQNGTLSDADLELLDVNKLNLSQTLMRYSQTLDGRPTQAALDPLRAAELLSVAKNEVKRQSGEATTGPADAPLRFTLDLAATTEATKPDGDKAPEASVAASSASSLTTTASTTTTTSTTTAKPELLTKEVETANGLEDSFPGGLDPVTEEPLPPPRRNGFYFFADWNSFLEVGEDPDKVVVRFDPKIGDPSRFIPIP